MNHSKAKSTKRCAHCNIEKLLTEFGAEKRKPDGLKPACKPCMVAARRAQYRKHRRKRIAATKQWRKENPGAHIQQARTYRKRLRLEVVAAYGGKCTCCGEATLEFLTLEHVNGGGRKHRGNRSSTNIYREVIKADFPKDYTVLCMNCNFAKGVHGACPHETARAALAAAKQS